MNNVEANKAEILTLIWDRIKEDYRTIDVLEIFEEVGLEGTEYCPDCGDWTTLEDGHTIKGRKDSMGAPEEPDETPRICPECGYFGG